MNWMSCDYDSTVAGETHSNRSREKMSPEFVSEIHVIIDNDLSIRINEVHRLGDGSVQVSYQRDRASKQVLFLYNLRVNF